MKPHPGCGGTAAQLVEEEGWFMSPGFNEGRYPNGVSCSWRIELPRGDEVRTLLLSNCHQYQINIT